jgi:hypothetical protein
MTYPAMRLRVLTRLPARVDAAAGLSAVVDNGTLRLADDWSALATVAPASLSDHRVMALNTVTGAYELLNAATLPADSVPWENVTDPPATFPPSAHGHTSGEISDFASAVDARAAVGIVATFSGVETSVPSAATADIGAAGTVNVLVTGTTTVTSFGTVANSYRVVRFAGALTLTHNPTSLILPGAVNIVTAANDVAVFRSDAAGNWRCIDYQRATREGVVPARDNQSTPDLQMGSADNGLSYFSGIDAIAVIRDGVSRLFVYDAALSYLPDGTNVKFALTDTNMQTPPDVIARSTGDTSTLAPQYNLKTNDYAAENSGFDLPIGTVSGNAGGGSLPYTMAFQGGGWGSRRIRQAFYTYGAGLSAYERIEVTAGSDYGRVNIKNGRLYPQDGFATKVKTLTLANGLNSNVAHPNAGAVTIAGPTGAFSLGGFADPVDGDTIQITNATGQAMTIVHYDASTPVANRIWCGPGGTNLTSVVGATLVYQPAGYWAVVGFRT